MIPPYICRVRDKGNGRGTGIRFSSASSSMYHVLKSNHERHENELVARHPFRFSEFFSNQVEQLQFSIMYQLSCLRCTYFALCVDLKRLKGWET